jgi:hypothetical protein
MFVHQSQLEHLLSPRDYHDPEFYRRELERLFLPAWHLIATRAQLPRPGTTRVRPPPGQGPPAGRMWPGADPLG